MDLFNFRRASRVKVVCAVALVATLAQVHAIFIATTIPDESPTELVRKAEPLAKCLEHKLGMKVKLSPVAEYATPVESLASKQVDLAWSGGFTFVQAQERSGGKAVPLEQREEYGRFHSVFLTSEADTNILADLKGATLSFCSTSSTPVPLMLRSLLLDGKIDPGKYLKRIAFSGAHDAIIAVRAAGTADAGALNVSV